MKAVSKLVMNISGGARAAHAFAIEGRAGETRNSFIRDLAAGLLCTSQDNGSRPCGRCPSCLQAYAGTSMDIVHMTRSTGASRTGREIYRVEDAAAFIERLSMGSYGRYLIGIIDDSDTLSEAIQNKLLKTLEEPAPDTLLFLGVSNRDNLLSTVQSRLSFVRISEYTDISAADFAEEEAASDDSKLAAAISTIVPMFTDSRAAFHEVRSALEKNIKSKEDALALIESLEDAFRDRMVAAGYGELSCDPSACAFAIEQINTARMDIRREMQYTRALKRLYLDLK